MARTPPEQVQLVAITPASLREVLALKVRPEQERFVAPNAVSLAEAYVHPEAWCRAICADGTPVGFVMLELRPEVPEFGVWRFMIDARHQGRGIGRRGMEAVIEHVRGLPGARELLLSFVDAEGSPEAFYASLGFERTGQVIEGEQVMRFALT